MLDDMLKPVDTTATPKGRTRRILAVDDDRMSLFVLEESLLDLGYEVDCFRGGREALEHLEQASDLYDAVVLDRMMPELDGLDVVRMMAKNPRLRTLPVVMVTGANSPEELREGIDAGVFHYLAKPVDRKLLQSVLMAAKRQGALSTSLDEENLGTGAFDLIQVSKFRFRTTREAETLAGFVANCFPDPERALLGAAALMLNAIEHGICGIGFEEKGRHLKDGTLQQEIDRYLGSDEAAEVYAEAAVTRKDGGVYLVVTDPGPGFRWKDFMQIDPSRASTTHGRGIARANASSFDKLAFNSAGNQAVAFMSHAEAIEW